jgi:hypothetical protein
MEPRLILVLWDILELKDLSVVLFCQKKELLQGRGFLALFSVVSSPQT